MATPRKSRYDKGMIKATDRDIQVLVWIAQQYAVRFDHVYELLAEKPGRGVSKEGLSESAARQVIGRWRRAGWVEAQQIVAGEPAWVWLTKDGLQKFGLPYLAAPPALSRIRHMHAVNAVRLMIVDEDDDTWQSERDLRVGKFYKKGETGHTPDAVLTLPSGEVIAIEVELTAKKPDDLYKALYELLNAWDDGEYRYSQVWYYVVEPNVERAVLQAKARQPYRPEKLSILRFDLEGLDLVEDEKKG